MRVCLACGLLLISLQTTIAAEPAKHKVEVDDHFTLAGIGDVVISPDGTKVAYAESRWQESTDDRKADLWVVPTAGGTPTRLTFDRGNYRALRWSPDSEYLYFVCSRRRPNEKNPPFDGTSQIWRLSLKESEPVAVTTVAGGIDNFDLAADGKSLFYTTSISEDAGEWSKLRGKFSKLKYGTVKRPKTSVFKLDAANWRATKVLEYDGAVVELAVSADGSRVAMVTGPDGTVATLEGQSKMTVLDVANGDTLDLPDDLWRKDAPSPYGRLNGPTWSADGEALAFACGYDAFPSEIFVATWKENDSKQPTVRKIARPDHVSLTGGVDGGTVLRWRGKLHDLCFLGDDRGRVRIYAVADAATKPQPAKSLTTGDVCADNFTWDSAGKRAAVTAATPSKMYDVHLLEDGDLKQLTEVNPHIKDWSLPKLSIFKWKGAGGETVEGVLELPASYKPGEELPLIVSIHGGPTAMSRYNMVYGLNGTSLFASRGYALLLPNYRGSTGYGDKFLTALVGHANEIEVEDILKGVDELVAEGIADKDRLGVCGWSNGGYLTNCLVTKTNRFKAASSGAGIADWTLEWGTNDEPGFATIFFGGPPWKATEAFRRTSPIFDFGKVKTPTLIHVGENDPRCPKGNSQMIHRALNDHCGVDTELVIYSGEGHGLNGYASRKAKLSWDLAWFDRYLKRETMAK